MIVTPRARRTPRQGRSRGRGKRGPVQERPKPVGRASQQFAGFECQSCPMQRLMECASFPIRHCRMVANCNLAVLGYTRAHQWGMIYPRLNLKALTRETAQKNRLLHGVQCLSALRCRRAEEAPSKELSQSNAFCRANYRCPQDRGGAGSEASERD